MDGQSPGGAGATRGQALYRKVAADLERGISEGAYGAGGRLPTEGALAEQYGVSRGTIRQAMSVLRTNGRVASRRGTRRVVLRTSQAQSFGVLLSFTRWARSMDEEPGGRVIRVVQDRATGIESEQLRVENGSPVCRLLRVRTLSGRPVMVERTVYPEAIGALVAELDRDTVSITVRLEEQGVLFADAQHTIDLVPADEVDAELLGCEPGDMLLREQRRSTDPAGAPIEFSEDRYLPGTVAFTVNSSAGSGSLARRAGRPPSG